MPQRALNDSAAGAPAAGGLRSRLYGARYRVLWGSAFAGLLVHFAGLAWDLRLHSQDDTLATREGVLTLSNPGHLLLFSGVGLLSASILGVAWMWLHDHRAGGRGVLARAVRFAAVPLVGVGAAGGIWLASAERDTVHDHAAQDAHVPAGAAAVSNAVAPASDGTAANASGGDGHSHAPAAQAPAAPAGQGSGEGAAMSEESAHFHHAEVAATEAQVRAAVALVDRVKTSTAQYEDVRAALKAGYLQATQDLPGIAAHFVRLDYLKDGIELDPDHAEVLLYTKRLDGTWRLVGVMFSSEAEGDTAPNYFGSLDSWHYHTNLCFTITGVRVVKEQAECRGGQFTAKTAWELHVWTQPGAAGMFSHDYAPISPGKFPPATRGAAAELAAQ